MGFTHVQMRAFDRTLLPEAPDLTFEQALWKKGISIVAGIDEAGRGALAGPVAAAAVILPPEGKLMEYLKGVRDSKQMTPEQREVGREKILNYAITWGVGLATSEEIDKIGILPATRLAAWRAIQSLNIAPSHILIDYLLLPEVHTPQTALVKGDCRSLSIAAASILAKTSRDAILRELECTYPGYGFARHKGYGTRAHREAIGRLGACPAHRLSFTLLGDLGSLVSESDQQVE